ncbi:MAG: hypothetical protein MUE60_00860, partial [Candidatus Eisenbacteria bacterium]|jgi:hypothetical protein|nr:hypothetical protein [Candidatus Eisenbacteria bacterium]
VGLPTERDSFEAAREIIGSDLSNVMRLLEDRFRKTLAGGFGPSPAPAAPQWLPDPIVEQEQPQSSI